MLGAVQSLSQDLARSDWRYWSNSFGDVGFGLTLRHYLFTFFALCCEPKAVKLKNPNFTAKVMSASKFGRASVPVLLGASTTFVCIVMAGELHGVRSLVSNQPGVSATTSVSGSPGTAPSPSLSILFGRPPSLPEPDQNPQTLRSYASRIGLYFGSMMNSLKGNGWETRWVRNTLGSEFNLMEPGESTEVGCNPSNSRHL